MLVEFRVKNHRSFADETVIQLDAERAIVDHRENLIRSAKGKFLKTLAIYGANASGKSNLTSAVASFRRFVLRSGKNNSTDTIGTDQFLLDKELSVSPSLFEIRFLIDNVFYRYGYEVTSQSVVSEWLNESSTLRGREAVLFDREGGLVTYGEAYTGERGFEKNLLPNTLLLSRLDQMNVEVATKILYAVSRLHVLQGLDDERVEDFTIRTLDDLERKDGVLALTRLADSGISDLKSRDVSESEMEPFWARLVREKKIPQPRQVLVSKIASNGQDVVDLSMDTHESAGTKKMFRFAGVWLDVLKKGSVVFVDEFEAKLHPLLTRYLVMMFNSADINTRGAQLVFVTHDTNLLAYGGLRRDQVWFCEKNRQGKSTLYSLVELDDRQDGEKLIEKNYIEGKYGAIPFFGGQTALATVIQNASRDGKGGM